MVFLLTCQLIKAVLCLLTPSTRHPYQPLGVATTTTYLPPMNVVQNRNGNTQEWRMSELNPGLWGVNSFPRAPPAAWSFHTATELKQASLIRWICFGQTHLTNCWHIRVYLWLWADTFTIYCSLYKRLIYWIYASCDLFQSCEPPWLTTFKIICVFCHL